MLCLNSTNIIAFVSGSIVTLILCIGLGISILALLNTKISAEEDEFLNRN